MVLAVILLTTATTWAGTVQFPIYSGDEGTEAKPYQIKTAADLVKLSDDVNSGTSYRNKYFKLMNDIDFSYTSDWNDITSTENNFNPIGKEVGFSTHSFQGTFDGNDKTISGIRIYKGTNNNSSRNVGLFGFLQGTVKKLTLTDTRIIGYSNTGGIVGYCSANSVVDQCTVTSTVAIYAILSGAKVFGGIVGNAESMTATITNNTSSATVAIKDNLGTCEGFGGILGDVASGATVSNNLANGVKVKDSSGNAGAIMGYSNHGAILINNYYINCTVNGTANALNVGCPIGDITENCAAVSLHTLTFAAGVTTTTTPSVNISGTNYYGQSTTIYLSGLPEVSAVNEFAAYTVNGEEINGGSFTMPAADVTVGAIFTVEWTGEGTESSPYLIQSCNELRLLAWRVNNAVEDAAGERYGADTKWYKLVADIQFGYADLGEMESNFEAIGKDQHLCRFNGHFLGNGHTVSGIRIRQGNKDNQGLFGCADGAEISGIILDDADITGKIHTGGIVGANSYGTVTDCHVTSTVIIRATENDTSNHGGIVGLNGEGGTVSSCTSAATLTVENDATGCNTFGGITGDNIMSTLNDNMALGVHLPNVGSSSAIIGHHFMGTLLRNYYSGCTKEGGGDVNGFDHVDVPNNDGAVPGIALYDHSIFSGLNSQTLQTVINNNDFGHPRIDLADRTLYKNGNWNTLCLPFDVNNLSGTPLAGATVMELDIDEMYDGYQTGLDGTTLYLYFKPASRIVAGKPYIVKWETTGEPIENPVFQVGGIDPEPSDVTSQDGKVQFKGIYDPTQLSKDDRSNLCLGAENQLYWPSADEALNAFRAYLHVDGTVLAIQSNVAFALMPEWPGDGTESSPYLIQSCENLRKLAQFVNNAVEDADGEPYKNKWYKLVADLQFDYADLGETESNFEAIGKNQHMCDFHGHFLGNGHTISGIRIRKGSEDDQGLFGYAEYSEISGIILDDADITGKRDTGGIVGDNAGSTVTDCHVTNTVIIRATENEAYRHGGIVGDNAGTVSGCTSAATLTVENDATGCYCFGGIAGFNSDTLSDNMVLGVHFPGIDDFGAITSNYAGGTLLRNYYSYCTNEGVDEVKGCIEGDITDNDGAVPGIALYDHSVFSSLNSRILQTAIGGHPRIDLAGRTLYKDGNWNTLCLPFNVFPIDNSPLAGATVMELDKGDKWIMEDGQWIMDNENGTCQTGLDGTTLYLYFKPASSIVAGWPYLVKWETDTEGTKGTEDTEINNPVFQNVTICSTESWGPFSDDGKVQFRGIYDPTQLQNDDKSNLCLGDENQLYWPSADEALNAFRAYLHVDGTVQAIQSNVLFALMGDVNGNGGIDIGDAVCIVNYLVNKNNTVFKDQLADLNGNGGIDIGDAVMIVNILVGKTNSSQTTGKGLQTIEEGLQTTDNNEPQ